MFIAIFLNIVAHTLCLSQSRDTTIYKMPHTSTSHVSTASRVSRSTDMGTGVQMGTYTWVAGAQVVGSYFSTLGFTEAHIAHTQE